MSLAFTNSTIASILYLSTHPFKSSAGDFHNWFEYQAYAYKHFYDVLEQKGCVEGLTFWGFTDKDWPNWERPGVGFFDQSFKPKPVHKVFETVLKVFE